MMRWGIVGVGGAAAALLIVAGLSPQSSAPAQPAQDPEPPPVELVVLKGVCILNDSTMGPTGAATRAPVRAPCPVIFVHPGKMRALPQTVQFYVYLHEYAHIIHGHGPYRGDSAQQAPQRARDEDEADCTVAMMMRDKWPLVYGDLLVMFRGTRREDFLHRADVMARCAGGR